MPPQRPDRFDVRLRLFTAIGTVVDEHPILGVVLYDRWPTPAVRPNYMLDQIPARIDVNSHSATSRGEAEERPLCLRL